jgi:hypothetical protein
MAHTSWWRPPDCMRFSLRKIAHAAPIRSREWAVRGSRGTCIFTFGRSECALGDPPPGSVLPPTNCRSLGFARDDKVEGRDFCEEPSDRMDRKKPQVLPLRSGSTARRGRRDEKVEGGGPP